MRLVDINLKVSEGTCHLRQRHKVPGVTGKMDFP